MNQISLKRLSLALLACSALSACETTQSVSDAATDAVAPIYAAALEEPKQVTEGSLRALERSYKNDPTNDVKAVRYAHALRELEYLNRASIILQPLADDPNSPAEAKSEYAAVQLELGNYGDAQAAAKKAIAQDPEHFQAYHYLGIAMDAEGEHAAAEEAFRNGLEKWDGDPTMIMNNLALNLAAQERLDDAITMLEDAQNLAPGRQEIERNLRIIRALKETQG